jgi:Na+-transporting NADH:ubiquinone oxidoreductase subunit A
MANLITIKRGLDIPINGKAVESIGNSVLPVDFAMIPDYYHGITPKLAVKEGDVVKAGTPVFFDKQFPDTKFVSPVSGTIKSINRGERRKIINILIENDGKMEYATFDKPSLTGMTREQIILQLQHAGLWAYVKQRPFDVIANPTATPKAIFISSFNSAPLSPNNDYVMGSQMSDFQVGIDVLSKIAPVQLGIRHGKKTPFSSVKNATLTSYAGPHPAGNEGIQINHISPVNKGEVVYTLKAQDVLFIGRFFNTGKVDFTRLVALTGPNVKLPMYFRLMPGVSLEKFLQDKIKGSGAHRIISGNVLTGNKIPGNGYLDPYASQITIMEEGNETHEIMGWGMPRIRRFSMSRAYAAPLLESKLLKKIFGNIRYQWDARLMGGRRAMIMSGEYDRVLPMDIYPEFLFKAMITNDIDKMEALGAYEIAPEDVALCEFVCTSKLPLQQIVRESLDLMKKELE